MRRVAKILSLITILALLPVGVATESAAAQADWSVTITAATDTEGSNPNLAFGTDGNATDSFDSGIDIPHPQPPTTFDAYFSIQHTLFPQLDKDYRAPGNNTIQWTLHLESNTEAITLTWDASAVPEEVQLWMSESGLAIDMKADNSTVLPAGTHTLTIATAEPATCGVIRLSQGWNLISLPLIPNNSNISVILADITGNVEIVWGYEAVTGTWTSWAPGWGGDLTNIVDGKGYWLNMNAVDTLIIEGVVLPLPPATPPTYHVVEGWNLIGFKSCAPATASEYLAGLGGNFTVIYGYDDSGYFSVPASGQLEPGHGYWIAATGAGPIYP